MNGDPAFGQDFTRSPYEYWQFWRNTEDADVGKFLRLFTDMAESEIADLETLEGAEINTAKIALANAATTLLHGEDAAKQAESTAQQTFVSGQTADGLPSVDVTLAELNGMGILTAATTVSLAGSNGEARRHIKQGALKLNDEKVATHELTLTKADIVDGVIKISVGKKKHALLKITDA